MGRAGCAWGADCCSCDQAVFTEAKKDTPISNAVQSTKIVGGTSREFCEPSKRTIHAPSRAITNAPEVKRLAATASLRNDASIRPFPIAGKTQGGGIQGRGCDLVKPPESWRILASHKTIVNGKLALYDGSHFCKKHKNWYVRRTFLLTELIFMVYSMANKKRMPPWLLFLFCRTPSPSL